MSKTIIVEAASKAQHTATVIFLHGLGDSGAGWAPMAYMMRDSPRQTHVKWILPTAPIQPVTMNHGYKMNSWFDIYDLRPGGTEDEKGLLESVSTVQKLIKQEIDNGIDPSRIIVGGFSQGAAISVLTGITTEYKLGGIVALSGFLTLSNKVKSMMVEHAPKYPLFWGHGTDDPVVAYEWGKRSVDKLRELGWNNIQFETYRGLPHSFCEPERVDFEAWLAKVIPEKQ
ncbi:hypothetical protein OIO90_003253 [Microbotryomycetes sp. JL221]|nr:hypothetical protein OIO90_003253 [Microbotryomycetes sp. JL221]